MRLMGVTPWLKRVRWGLNVNGWVGSEIKQHKHKLVHVLNLSLLFLSESDVVELSFEKQDDKFSADEQVWR